MIDFSSTQMSNGSLTDLPKHLHRLGAKNWVVVCDSNLKQCIEWGWNDRPLLVVPAGESSKSLQMVERLYGQLAELAVDRQTWLIAVGGGVVGDLAGFVAATYLRGLSLVQVPTSLVAQVDSSLGGKVGVDLPAGKNLVGSFYPARLIHLDTQLLDTLPEAEWNSGMAEVLKHGLLDGPQHWDALQELAYPLTSQQRLELVERSRAVKRDIVLADPLEQGVRAYLNLGHTLAHAIESAQNYAGWNHGQAVGFGLRAALRLSQWKCQLDPCWEVKLVAQLERYNLPSTRPDLPFRVLPEFLKRDKKNQDGKLRFVLLERPGAAKICSTVTLEELERCWEELA